MGKYAVHRQDANSRELLDAFQARGCRCQQIHHPVDYAVAIPTTTHGWVTALVEFKDRRTPIRPVQDAFIALWPGLTAVVRDVAAVHAFVDDVQQHLRDIHALRRQRRRSDSPR